MTLSARELFVSGVKLDELGVKNYLNELPVVQHLLRLPRLNFTTPVTFFIGENGSGKSTLVEAIAVAMKFNAEGGSRALRFSTVATESELHTWLTVIRATNPRSGFFLRAETYYNLASAYNEYGDPDDPVDFHARSHGQSVMEMLRRRMKTSGLFILDEPEAGLSPRKQIELLKEITAAAEDGSQFFIATHSPILLAVPGATILELGAQGLRVSSYDDAAIVRDTRDFLCRWESADRI